MKNQPVGLSMMILKRRVARERRMEKYTLLKDWRDDLRREREFESSLSQNSKEDFVKVYDNIAPWGGFSTYRCRYNNF
jgi:hypothetical protein